MTVRVSESELNFSPEGQSLASDQAVPTMPEVTLMDIVAEVRRDSRSEASRYLHQAVAPFGGE